ncbi:hypothetical protein M514_09576 [Trichuris suis]|uniref:Uncharacterized protein n=1 Tax=Trichuris suis TaxID=68888 RepID=A0A085N437_9BILA|nr:hypothetical protein M513_09576 [Trichuris suis]KFD64233.1 hypothetical protein M514_09576 [Trichuris suis]
MRNPFLYASARHGSFHSSLWNSHKNVEKSQRGGGTLTRGVRVEVKEVRGLDRSACLADDARRPKAMSDFVV